MADFDTKWIFHSLKCHNFHCTEGHKEQNVHVWHSNQTPSLSTGECLFSKTVLKCGNLLAWEALSNKIGRGNIQNCFVHLVMVGVIFCTLRNIKSKMLIIHFLFVNFTVRFHALKSDLCWFLSPP
jgi:hypothetical protein